MPYSKGCKIVFRGKKLEFYQIQYRNFGKTAKVKTFNGGLTPQEKTALANVSTSWLDIKKEILANQAIEEIAINQNLDPGQQKTLLTVNKPGRLLGFEIENAKQFEGLNKLIDIKITWDNENEAAIYMPLADFFGYAFGKCQYCQPRRTNGCWARRRRHCRIPCVF
ncbi:MAG: DUF2961 domain-containing protein [Sphingobacteriales bacterium]|nr:MAG: DUF2961 domain-containing protein [Sphingobacteriales bacterium]